MSAIEPAKMPAPKTPEPVAPPRVADPREAMEEAILAEASHPDRFEAEAQAQVAAALLDEPHESRDWHHGAGEIEAPLGARIGRDLTIVSVGEASRVDERSVRVPLVLGDAEGETSTLVLTVRLDPLVDESDG